jgi:glyoxylase-like metal-dependent hydrolase (beta-lactamase superfamily II)
MFFRILLFIFFIFAFSCTPIIWSGKDNQGETVRIEGFDAGMCRVYLIETGSSLFLVDAGSPGEEIRILRHIKKYGDKKLRLIFITHGHFDHYGSAAALRRMTGALIAIHKDDAMAMAEGRTELDSVGSLGVIGRPMLPLVEMVLKPEKTKADLLLIDGDRLDSLGLPAVVVHTPGHTKGSSTLLVLDSLAFVGDLIAARPWAELQCYYANSWSEINRSLQKLKKLSPARVFAGHGSHVLTRKEIQGLDSLSLKKK